MDWHKLGNQFGLEDFLSHISGMGSEISFKRFRQYDLLFATLPREIFDDVYENMALVFYNGKLAGTKLENPQKIVQVNVLGDYHYHFESDSDSIQAFISVNPSPPSIGSPQDFYDLLKEGNPESLGVVYMIRDHPEYEGEIQLFTSGTTYHFMDDFLESAPQKADEQKHTHPYPFLVNGVSYLSQSRKNAVYFEIGGSRYRVAVPEKLSFINSDRINDVLNSQTDWMNLPRSGMISCQKLSTR